MVKQSFKASNRIKKNKEIELIFKKGKILISENKKLKATFLTHKSNTKFVIKFGVVVHKKAGTAVWRNRFKRLIREAYRKNRYIFFQYCNEDKLLIYLVISPNNLNQSDSKRLSLSEIEPVVIELISRVADSA